MPKELSQEGLGGASKAEEMRLEWLSALPVVARDDCRLPRGGASSVGVWHAFLAKRSGARIDCHRRPAD